METKPVGLKAPGAAFAFWVALAVVSVALVWSLSVVDYLPTNDGPQSILSGHIENHFFDPGTVYSRQLEPTLQFAYRGFSALFVPLESVLPWRVALRVTLSLGVIANLWAFAGLLDALAPGRRFLAPLGAPFILSWNLYMGFYAYLVGTALGLLLMASAVGGKPAEGREASPLTARRRTLIGAGLLAQACCHVFSAALSGLVIALVLLARAPRGGRARELLRVVAMGAPAMTVLFFATLDERGLAQVALASTFEWVPLRQWLAELPRMIASGPALKGWLAVAMVVAALVGAAVRWRRGALRGDERALVVAASGLLALGLAAPLHVPGWQFFSPRFLPVGCLLAVALLPFEGLCEGSSQGPAGAATPRARLLLPLGIALVTALGVASVVMSAGLHQKLAAGCAPALAGLDAPIHRSALRLPVVLDSSCGVSEDPVESEVPFLRPLQHAGALYAVTQGGSIPYLFIGSSAVHAFRARSDLRFPVPPVEHYLRIMNSEPFAKDPAVRGGVLTELAAYGRSYEDVILLGAQPEDQEAWLARGYVPSYQGPSVLVAQFRGCGLILSLPTEAARHRPRVELGPWPVLAALVEFELSPPAAGAPDTVAVGVKDLLCGEAWLRVTWGGDGTDARAPGRRGCAGADADGRLRLDLHGADGRVPCRPAGQ